MTKNSNADILPGTDDRVPRHTSDSINARIRERTLQSLRVFVGASHQEIDARIAELHREWDIERTLEANAAAVIVLGIVLGVAVNRRFFVLPALVSGFLFQHAMQVWCPPLPILRRFGVRTSAEIHAEIVALRVLRGDFRPEASRAAASLALATS